MRNSRVWITGEVYVTDHQAAARLQHLEWLVKSRADVQETLLTLYKYVATPAFGHPALTDYIIYAAFSLWRAVFLAESDRDWEAMFKGQKEFLAKLVEDNTITYTDDKNNRAWTVGFYLNAAKCNIEAAAKHVAKSGPQYPLHGPVGPAENTRAHWNELHHDLRWIINQVCGSILKD
jgi:hypothetical protein